MPTEWERRVTRLWIALSAAWLAIVPLVVFLASDQDGLHSWLADPEVPGWVWLVAPPLALGVLLRIAAGVSHAAFRRSALYWDDLPGAAGRAAKPGTPRATAPADRSRKGTVRKRSPEPARHGRS